MSDFIILGSKITTDVDCSHEIKRRLLLGRKVMINLDSIFKSTNSWCSALFMVQLLHPYMTIGKTIAFIGKVMSLLFNILSTLVIAFLPSSKCLLISWLQSTSAVILESNKIKSVTVSIVSSFMCHEVMGPMP